MSAKNQRNETQRPDQVELQNLDTDDMQELTADDASAVRGGGATSVHLASLCTTGSHIKKAIITV